MEGPTDGWLLIRIEDDGPGFDVRNVTMGLGLSVMQDYAQAIGGTSEIVSAPNSGTTIAARLPIETEVEPPGLDEDEPSAY